MTYDRLIDAAKAWDTDKGENVEFHTPWRSRKKGLCSEDLYFEEFRAISAQHFSDLWDVQI